MPAFDYDLFVIGGGSGGVRSGRLAAAMGKKVAIAEEFRFGGTCVIRGCVPKKLYVYASQFGEHFEDAAGFGWSVKLDKGDFLGKEALAAQKAGQLEKKVVGLKLEGRNIAREGYAVYQGDRQVGRVLSGTFSPTLQAPIATALVEKAALDSGEPLSVEIRTQKQPATIVKLPFYRRSQS